MINAPYTDTYTLFLGNARVQRKLFLQLATWALAQTSFQLAPKAFLRAELISQFFCYSNSSKNITCPSDKLKTEFTSPIAKSTNPGLLDTTFFACWMLMGAACWPVLQHHLSSLFFDYHHDQYCSVSLTLPGLFGMKIKHINSATCLDVKENIALD